MLSRMQRYLPFEIWHRQKCPNCNRTLTVGPVMLSNETTYLCGRCTKAKAHKNVKFIKSLYNIVACGYSFACLYSYLGCSRHLSIFEMANHEPHCNATLLEPLAVFCRLCKFKATEMIDFVMHMRRRHLEEALSEGSKTLYSITVDHKVSKLCFLEDGIFMMYLEYQRASTFMMITIECLTIVKPRLFSIKIENAGDPSNHLLAQSKNDPNSSLVVIRKKYSQLNDVFGLSTVLSYQLIVENLDTLGYEEHTSLLKYDDVRKNEQACEEVRGRFKVLTKLKQGKFDVFKNSLDILKYVAPTIIKCNSCNIINPGIKHYICSEGHIYCKACMRPKCEACKGPREFNSIYELQRLKVHCEWPECKVTSDLHYYMSHKATCSHRTYFCPLKGCYKNFTSIQKLAEHWHAVIPGIMQNNRKILIHKFTQQEFFWACNHDIYRVLVNFTESIQIIVEDFDVVLVNNKIHCYAIKENVKEEIPSSLFCGYYQAFMENRPAGNPDQRIYNQLEIEIEQKST